MSLERCLLLWLLANLAAASVLSPHLNACRSQLHDTRAAAGVPALVEERDGDPQAVLLSAKLTNCRMVVADFEGFIRMKLELEIEKGEKRVSHI